MHHTKISFDKISLQKNSFDEMRRNNLWTREGLFQPETVWGLHFHQASNLCPLECEHFMHHKRSSLEKMKKRPKHIIYSYRLWVLFHEAQNGKGCKTWFQKNTVFIPNSKHPPPPLEAPYSKNKLQISAFPSSRGRLLYIHPFVGRSVGHRSTSPLIFPQ